MYNFISLSIKFLRKITNCNFSILRESFGYTKEIKKKKLHVIVAYYKVFYVENDCGNQSRFKLWFLWNYVVNFDLKIDRKKNTFFK